jgi:hypothetical protein
VVGGHGCIGAELRPLLKRLDLRILGAGGRRGAC